MTDERTDAADVRTAPARLAPEPATEADEAALDGLKDFQTRFLCPFFSRGIA